MADRYLACDTNLDSIQHPHSPKRKYYCIRSKCTRKQLYCELRQTVCLCVEVLQYLYGVAAAYRRCERLRQIAGDRRRRRAASRPHGRHVHPGSSYPIVHLE